MPLRTLLFVLGLNSVLCVAGCGNRGSVEKLVPVGGTLLIDGEALDGVIVSFIPDVSKKDSRGGTGTTDATGVFTIIDLDQNRPGLPVGKYTLAYSRRRLPDGSAAPKPEKGAPPKIGVIQVESLPPHLTIPNPKVPSNQVEIPKEGNTKLELKVSKKNAPLR